MPNSLVAVWTCPLCDMFNGDVPYCFGCGRPRNLPANPQESLSELYDEVTRDDGLTYRPLSNAFAIAGKVIPREPWSYCAECGQFIYLADDNIWRDKGMKSLSGLCAGNGDVLHQPARECAYCLAPAGHCAHVYAFTDEVRTVMTMFKLDISRSQWTPDRWLMTGCCPACWQGDLLGDLEDHCGLCPCCDTDGVSRKHWTDKLGKTYDSPLEVPRNGPANPFPYPRKPSVHQQAVQLSFSYEFVE